MAKTSSYNYKSSDPISKEKNRGEQIEKTNEDYEKFNNQVSDNMNKEIAGAQQQPDDDQVVV